MYSCLVNSVFRLFPSRESTLRIPNFNFFAILVTFVLNFIVRKMSFLIFSDFVCVEMDSFIFLAYLILRNIDLYEWIICIFVFGLFLFFFLFWMSEISSESKWEVLWSWFALCFSKFAIHFIIDFWYSQRVWQFFSCSRSIRTHLLAPQNQCSQNSHWNQSFAFSSSSLHRFPHEGFKQRYIFSSWRFFLFQFLFELKNDADREWNSTSHQHTEHIPFHWFNR